jgi:branched-chain amino acid transport system ATP-binding protein
MMLLEAKNIDVAYGQITVLHDLNVNIEQGEIVALVGANGAGKTTLLRTISGLLRPRRGQITWRGNTPLRRLPPYRISRLGISHVPEGRQVFSNLTVLENLRLGAYARRDRHGIATDLEKCYELFPILKERSAQRSGTLSGGQQQMLAIARALMSRPSLLLLDEPSLGLAPLVVRTIFQTIRDLNAAGVTMFLVEQNANMALSIAHRGYVIQTGRILLHDKAATLLQHPDVKKAYLGG